MKKTKKGAQNELSAVESVTTEKYLTFFIDSQLFTIPTIEVVEIIRIQPITYLPNLPAYVKGVINLRGKIVPLIDVRLKFDKAEKEYDSRTSIVIVECSEQTVGLIVDSVKDVRDIAVDQILPAPKHEKTTGDHYVRNIANLGVESAMVLDTQRILTHKENARAMSEADFQEIKAIAQ